MQTAVYICQKSLNFIYAFKNATSKNVSWPLLVLTLSTRYWTVFAEFGLGPALLCSLCIGIFVLVSSFLIFILWVMCVRLS